MKREQTKRLATIGARAEITRLANEIGDYVREIPELRKHARATIEAVLTTPEARTEKAIAKGVKKRPKMSAEARAKISKAMKKRMKAFWKQRRELEGTLSDTAAAKKAHAMPPVATRKARKRAAPTTQPHETPARVTETRP